MAGVDGSFGWGVPDTDFPAVRRVMGPERNRLDDTELEGLLEERFPGADPLDVEDFMRSVQILGKRAAPIAQQALPGAVQGAKAGVAGGLPGIVAGATAGGVASVAGGRGRQPSTPAATGPMTTPGGTAPGLPVSPDVPGLGRSGAGQLLVFLLQQPTLEALLALLMSNAGRPTVRVGATSVPPTAFAEALAELAAAAAAEAFEAP